MSQRIKKVNRHIQRTFGEILHKEADLPPDVLVTISHVETSKNLQSTVVWLYITPSSREEEVMELLSPQMYDLQGSLNRKLTFTPLPRVTLKVDHGLHHEERINKKLDEIT